MSVFPISSKPIPPASILRAPILFGADAPKLEAPQLKEPLAVDTVSLPAKNGNILLPSGIPIFYLHGTFSTGDMLGPIVNFINNIQTTHPSYIAYLPEVKDGTGIETVVKNSRHTPAYKLANREMGDFHYQVTHNNVKALKAAMDAPGTPAEQQERVAEFFDIMPEERPIIGPIVSEYLAKRIFTRPPAFTTGDTLANIVSKRVAKVRAEAEKLDLQPGEKDKAVIDTHFLKTKATMQGKKVNLELNKTYHDPKIINLRSTITFKDIAVLESYLMFLEKQLKEALYQGFTNAYRESLDEGALNEEVLQLRAQKTATKLMEKIAPQGMAFGHSQGGTVLLSALLNYLAKAPKVPEKAFIANAPGTEELGGRYIGIEALFSSPVKGIPEEPAWGRNLSESIEKWIHGAKKPYWLTHWMLKKIMWKFFDHKRPAVQEMKVNSPLMKKFQDTLHLVRDQGVTVVSAHDVADTFIEPSATILTDYHHQTPKNVFNVAIAAPVMPQRFEDGLSIIEAEIRNLGLSPNAFLVRVLRWLPNKMKEAIFEAYLGVVTGLGQHSALVNHPDYVRRELGKKMIVDPQMQTRILDTSNFEPFRYQALIARGKSYQKNILSLPTAEAIQALSVFERQYPTFLQALIENAKEGIPVRRSAAYAATEIINNTLDLMDKTLLDPNLKEKFAYSIQRGLRQIAGADLPPLAKGLVSPSLRAQRMFVRMNETEFK